MAAAMPSEAFRSRWPQSWALWAAWSRHPTSSISLMAWATSSSAEKTVNHPFSGHQYRSLLTLEYGLKTGADPELSTQVAIFESASLPT
ncbi:hypothetical protein NDU88_008490 [Pleurodeles waltl]|uniref:Secreted protein n=1 Tax=Pleurodeles waltl TaxID=8319 RepID=A0AAV7RTC7_PLEWA|nr:hypothetical protein NDU88_008490 [Pleurodeles waltl]